LQAQALRRGVLPRFVSPGRASLDAIAQGRQFGFALRTVDPIEPVFVAAKRPRTQLLQSPTSDKKVECPLFPAQARGANLFLYRHVLEKNLGSLDAVRAYRPKRLPTVLSKDEVRRLFAAMPEKGAHRLIVELLYGIGMRISECCQLRVCDLDFDRGQIVIRGGKGKNDRVTMLPHSLEERLKSQVEFVRLRHEHDVENGAGYAPVPTSLEHNRHGAARELRWQSVFGSSAIRLDRETGRRIRWYAHPGAVDRTVQQAADVARIGKRATCHTLRHSFAMRLQENGYDIRTVQRLLGHKSVKMTMIFTHVMARPGLGVRSPLDG
jgi:integron integrase